MSDYKIGSIVPLTEESKEARLVYALGNLNSTIAERDQLRAELAAAKAEIQTWRMRHRDAMDTATRKVQQAEEVAAERYQLRADNARLRAALEEAFEGAARQLAEPCNHGNDQYALTAIATTCELTLAAPPAQSLAAHDAALLREVMNLIRQTTPDPVDGVPESFGAHQGRMYAMEQIGAEADRIEKEAKSK